jgi:hypothetical protein
MPTLRGNHLAFDYAAIWRVDSNGIAVGQLDPITPGSTPLTSHALSVEGGMTCELPGATFGTFEFRGAGSYEGQVDGGLESLGNGTLTLSQCDANLAVLLAGGELDTTTITGGPTIWSVNKLNPSPRQVGLMLIRRIQSQVAASQGIVTYATTLFPLVQMRLEQGSFSQDTGLNTSPVTCSIRPQVGSRFPWGEAFGSNQDWHSNQNIEFNIQSDYPWSLTAFIADGVETTYTLEFLPIYSTVTGGRANAIYAIDGVPTAPTSVVTTTGVVTIAAAGDDGDRHVGFYQNSRLTA